MTMNDADFERAGRTRHGRKRGIEPKDRKRIRRECRAVKAQVFAFYGILLHFLHSLIEIEKGEPRTMQDKKRMLNDEWGWMRNKYGSVLAYPLSLIILFLSARDMSGGDKSEKYRSRARSFLHFDQLRSQTDSIKEEIEKGGLSSAQVAEKRRELANRIAKTAWNASWDLLYVQRLLGMQSGSMFTVSGGERRPIDTVLVSNDFDPNWLRLVTLTVADQNFDNDWIGIQDLQRVVNPNGREDLNQEVDDIRQYIESLKMAYGSDQTDLKERELGVYQCIIDLEQSMKADSTTYLSEIVDGIKNGDAR
ncbi:hypothetical protein [Bifidobacterium callimiconis]|nr:hypothetical protein [Bifidobacterium callimiconis]